MEHKHFENLWEDAEALFQENVKHLNSDDIIQELLMKIQLFKTFSNANLTFANDYDITKTRLLGEIVLTISQLSAKENINVYDGLYQAVKFRQ